MKSKKATVIRCVSILVLTVVIIVGAFKAGWKLSADRYGDDEAYELKAEAIGAYCDRQSTDWSRKDIGNDIQKNDCGRWRERLGVTQAELTALYDSIDTYAIYKCSVRLSNLSTETFRGVEFVAVGSPAKIYIDDEFFCDPKPVIYANSEWVGDLDVWIPAEGKSDEEIAGILRDTTVKAVYAVSKPHVVCQATFNLCAPS